MPGAGADARDGAQTFQQHRAGLHDGAVRQWHGHFTEGKDTAVGAQRHRVPGSRRHGHHAAEACDAHAHLFRPQGIDPCAQAQGATGVLAPAQHAAVGAQCERTPIASRDGHGACHAGHPLRRGPAGARAVTQRAVGVATPGPNAAVGRERQRVRGASGHSAHPRQAGHALRPWLQGRSDAAQLTQAVVAPGPDTVAVGRPGQRVRPPGGHTRWPGDGQRGAGGLRRALGIADRKRIARAVVGQALQWRAVADLRAAAGAGRAGNGLPISQPLEGVGQRAAHGGGDQDALPWRHHSHLQQRRQHGRGRGRQHYQSGCGRLVGAAGIGHHHGVADAAVGHGEHRREVARHRRAGNAEAVALPLVDQGQRAAGYHREPCRLAFAQGQVDWGDGDRDGRQRGHHGPWAGSLSASATTATPCQGEHSGSQRRKRPSRSKQ